MYGDLVEWRKEGGCKAMWENEPTQNQKQIPIHDGNKDSLKWHSNFEIKPFDFTRFVFLHVQFYVQMFFPLDRSNTKYILTFFVVYTLHFCKK